MPKVGSQVSPSLRLPGSLARHCSVGVQGARRMHSRKQVFLLSFPAHLGPGLPQPFLSDSLNQVSGEEDVVAEPWADPPTPTQKAFPESPLSRSQCLAPPF